MKNTTKNAILAAVRNVDDATYEKTIKWWANDAIGSLGEYLLKIWSNYYNRSMGSFIAVEKLRMKFSIGLHPPVSSQVQSTV